MTAEEVDAGCEELIKNCFGSFTDFEVPSSFNPSSHLLTIFLPQVSRVLRFLLKVGIVEYNQGRYYAVPPAQATPKLEHQLCIAAQETFLQDPLEA
jgi:hypothetical protein